MSQRAQHPLDLMIFSLVDGDLAQRLVLARFKDFQLRGGAGEVLKRNPRGHARRVALGQSSLDARDVNLVLLPARRNQPVRQLAVGGHEHQPGHVPVQPPHRADLQREEAPGQIVGDGRLPARILRGGQNARGLVDHQVQVLARAQRRAVQAHARAVQIDLHRRVVNDAPVHGHAPRLHHRRRFLSGRAVAREQPVQPHFSHCLCSPC